MFEAGTEAGGELRAWGHVRLFSPWSLDVDPVAATILEASGWHRPAADAFPTGHELVDRYLGPLAALPSLAGHIHLGTRVRFVTRAGRDDDLALTTNAA